MRHIWKYPIAVIGTEQVIEMPKDANILTVQMQNDKPVMWAMVDTPRPMEKRTFIVYGTGCNIPDNIMELNYINTFQKYHGSLIFHLFEL